MDSTLRTSDFEFLFNRHPETHKGDYGHALLIAGSFGKMGAAVLAARACLRAGAGLLTVHVPRCGVDIMQTAVPEAMVSVDNDEHCFSSLPPHLERYDAIAVGPGLGIEEPTEAALLRLLETLGTADFQHSNQLIIDADGLNILSRHPEAIHLAVDSIITPHHREYLRLFGDGNTQDMADIHKLIIVRKAHHTTVFAPSCEPIVNMCGNAGMATAGSGDVLTGIMLGIAAQASAYCPSSGHVSPQQVAAMAVWLHGMAGDKAVAKRGNIYSVVAGDIIDSL